ncbi:MAG: hypothetical protein RBR02_10185 [Desulfuromonadaceae bacterium]|nr:hypothetical protein [Desulfuromonadaceae bacterium]
MSRDERRRMKYRKLVECGFSYLEANKYKDLALSTVNSLCESQKKHVKEFQTLEERRLNDIKQVRGK